jgi:MscS family membrane protein
MRAWLWENVTSGDWREVLATVLVILAAWLAAQIYVFVIDQIARRWASRTSSTLDDKILAVVRRPGFLLIFLIGVYAASHRFQFRMRGVVDGILFVLAVLIVFYSLLGVFGVLLEWWADRLGRERQGENVARDLLPIADKFLRIVIMVIGSIIVLDHFAIDVKSILVTLGVGSLAIGLALQDTLANMFGGFTIMIDRPFRVGDRIQLQTGEIGDVKAIGIRSTTVMMLNSNLLIVPNSMLVKNSIINQSFPDTRSQVIIEIGVAYGTDPSRVKQILLESARIPSDVLEDPAPAVFFKAFGDFALQFMLVCHAKSFRSAMVVRDAVNSAVNERFRAEGIEIPYPIQDVRISNSGVRFQVSGIKDSDT